MLLSLTTANLLTIPVASLITLVAQVQLEQNPPAETPAPAVEPPPSSQ